MRKQYLLGLLFITFNLINTAWATPVAELNAALKQAQSLVAQGKVQISVIFPPRLVPTRFSRKLPVLPFRPNLIAKNFKVSQRNADLVAGRSVMRFDLTPKVGRAAHWILWIDRKWNVPLAFEERMSDTLARRAVFLDVEPAPIDIKRRNSPIPKNLRKAVFKALPGLRLPPGFTPAAVHKNSAGHITITLTDGANILGLVIASRDVRRAQGIISRAIDKHFVWLVGNLADTPLKAALAHIRAVYPERLGTFLAKNTSNY